MIEMNENGENKNSHSILDEFIPEEIDLMFFYLSTEKEKKREREKKNLKFSSHFSWIH